MIIRTAGSREDWAAIRRICCETAYAGAGLSDRTRWEFFAEMWVGPYERLVPGWTLVAQDGEAVVGYLTGCPDTAAFERRRPWRHGWPLAAGVVLGRYPANEDTRSFLRRLVGAQTPPDRRFPRRVRELLKDRYPAHLHMNLSAGHRGRGTGRLLLARYWERLRAERIPGVHVHCGEAPVGFYRRAGLDPLDRLTLADGRAVHVLTKDLS